MKLYITDSEKLSVFTLPSEQKDSFVIDYKAPGKIDEHIVIYLKNNSWIISKVNYSFAHLNFTVILTNLNYQRAVYPRQSR